MSTLPASDPTSPLERLPASVPWRDRLTALAFGAVFVALTTATLTIQWPTGGRFTLQTSEVSPADIRAPQSVEYISDSLTEEARKDAERRVADVYEPARRARSEQIARSNEMLDAIEAVRNDASISFEQKTEALQALPDVQLEPGDWQLLLMLDDEAWKRVRTEAPAVINAVMLAEIRETQLAAVMRNVPNYVNSENDDEARLSTALARTFIKPNMLLNESRTQTAQAEARAAVAPQIERYEAGEIILREGDLVTVHHLEALNALGLNEPGWNLWRLVSSLIVSLVLALIFGLYLYRPRQIEALAPRQLGLLMALLATFLVLAKLMVPERTVLPYLFPLAAATMLINAFLGLPLTFLGAAYFGIVLGFVSGGALPVGVVAVATGLIGALVLGRGERPSAFVRAGAAVSVVCVALLVSFNLPFGRLDLTGTVQLLSAGVLNGVLSASIALVGFYLLGAIFDISTPQRLMELARPNHPLMRDLVMKAPGTYHHSLLVSNLAEQAAEAIGADAYLTRIGAYYHDIGKLARPYFFTENRVEGLDPHKQLDPLSSAQIIISHIKDGLVLARRHKLPRRIQDFIAEHQGTGLVRFFYAEAQKAAGDSQLDDKPFRYPGPRPRSRETALVMLADTCESAVRAARPETREQIDEIVRKMFNQRLIEGELAESDLTLRDLETTRRIFVRSLQGVHHPRLVYPEIKPPQSESASSDESQPQTQPAAAA